MTSSYNPGPEFQIDREYIPGPQFNPSSGYGPRNAPAPGASTIHHGLDFKAPLGTPIPAAADGEVYYTGAAQGFGLVVILKHIGADGATYFTVYGHMNQLPNLTLGQPVKAGQEIGKVGNNGISTGPHLHFETVDGDTAFNHVINGARTGVTGDVNRVNPSTFDFHGNAVFNGNPPAGGSGAQQGGQNVPPPAGTSLPPTNPPSGSKLPGQRSITPPPQSHLPPTAPPQASPAVPPISSPPSSHLPPPLSLLPNLPPSGSKPPQPPSDGRSLSNGIGNWYDGATLSYGTTGDQATTSDPWSDAPRIPFRRRATWHGFPGWRA